LLHGDETRLYGDSAYANQKEALKATAPKAKDFTNKRAYRNKPLTERDKQVNRTKSQTRAKVEHPFLTLKRIWGNAQSALPWLSQECQSRVRDAGFDQHRQMEQTAQCIGAFRMRQGP
jgi:IS5 family transposase